MHYTLIYAGLTIYFTGALTVFLVFRKRILRNSTLFNTDDTENTKAVPDPFYALFAANIDLSIYSNVTEAIELERQRIGSDIHDEMAPYLASLYVDLELTFKESNALSLEANQTLLGMRHKIKYTMIALRKIIYGMLPATLERENLSAAIKELCTKNDGTKGTTILFRTSGQQFPLNDQQKLYLYRIVQEVINNCLEHSLAWSIFVSVYWTNEELKIAINDTGVGMRKAHNHIDSYGMTGIFIRCKIIGAVAKFNVPYEGVEFELTLRQRPD